MIHGLTPNRPSIDTFHMFRIIKPECKHKEIMPQFEFNKHPPKDKRKFEPEEIQCQNHTKTSIEKSSNSINHLNRVVLMKSLERQQDF